MIDINPFADRAELVGALRTFGKRAQARIKTLEKAYAPGGSMYGRKSYVLDMYGDIDTKTAGLSEQAIRNKVEKALKILEASTSTVKGVKDVDRRRYETFRKNHPEAKVTVFDKDGNPVKDRKGNDKTRPVTQKDYVRAMQIFNKLKTAENNAKFGYEEQMYAAFQMAKMGEIQYEGQTLTVEDLLTDDESNAELPFSIHDYFSSLEPSATIPFFSTEEP